MTQTQRRIIEQVIERAERGPSMPPYIKDPVEAERSARIWSQTWVEMPLRAILDNVDGTISAAELGRRS